MMMAVINILCDRMLFDEWDVASADEPAKIFLRDTLKKESSTVLAETFSAVLENNEVMDGVVLKRPDFMNIFLLFTLKANVKLQHDCLNFLYLLLQHRSSR